MYLKILKTNDILLAAKNGEIHTNDDCWIIPEIAHPPIEKIPDEILKRINTPEQFEELIKNTRFYLQDSEDKNIIYKFVIQETPYMFYITTDIYDNRKYLCGKISGFPFFKTFDFPEYKKELKFMIELSRKYR